MIETPLARFENKIWKNPITGCWDWVAQKNKDGYGEFSYKGKVWLSHRFSYQLFKDDLVEGLEIHHICANKTCVNPDHLDQITNEEHNRKHKINLKRQKHDEDVAAIIRFPFGVPHPFQNQLEEVHEEMGEYKEIMARIISNTWFSKMAKEYGIDMSQFKVVAEPDELLPSSHRCALLNAEYGITDEERLRDEQITRVK